MAFCPNCGTPNTDQAEKCVSCAFELSPKHKAKFKGTIMMSGVQAPGTPGQPAAAPPAAAPPQPAAPAVFTPASHAPVQAPPAGPRNLAFEKTMMGVPPGAGMPQTPSPAQPSAADLGRAATVEQQAPSFQQPPAAQFQPPAQPYQPPVQPAASSFSQPATPAAGGFSSGAQSGSGQSAGFGGGGGGGGFSSDSEVPAPPKSNTGKMIAIGCGVLFVLACVITGIVVMVKGKQFFSSVSDKIESEGATLEWRTRVAQSLENVLEICKTDCKGAAVYFHPQLETQLMAEAKGLSQNGLVKLIDPTQSDARMLDGTDDAALATKLNLDPQQCVRITSGSAKVVGCSVPDPAGNSSLRIVHLEGVASL